ncbi:MAG: ribbon-helix-helix protein, CopG family [Candidatus Tectomicrobia bacterium]|uniref:Ribbon-helix-helix protein, CopG family n=1 Tax=Tectimicrobiota bacterium TaxID=2528274 RepID=A0A932GQF5_UNCTE|nr:ribbon-helix-helix protein, CopG family [Candidatus Tectomicrobia bacterium]
MAISKSVKVAISLPRDTWKKLEAVRRERGETRSALFLEAVHLWLENRDRQAQIRRYEEGYRRIPESPEEVAACEQAAAALLATEEWA